MSIIERALAKAKQEDRAAVEDAEGLVHRAQVAPGRGRRSRGRPGRFAPDVGEAAARAGDGDRRRVEAAPDAGPVVEPQGTELCACARAGAGPGGGLAGVCAGSALRTVRAGAIRSAPGARPRRRGAAAARRGPALRLRCLPALARAPARARAAALAARGRWGLVRDRARAHLRAGGRVGLRQIHRGAPDRGPARALGRARRVRRPRRRRGARQRRAPEAAPPLPDDLPGPLRQPQPALAGGAHHRRADPRVRPGDGRRGDPRARRRAAGPGRPVAGRRREVSARVLRRPAPAHLHRARARQPAPSSSCATSRPRRSTCRCRRRSST